MNKSRGRGAFRGKFNKPSKPEEDKTNVHPQLLKQARKSGQLNLSGRSMCEVPVSVWRVNVDTPEESQTANLEAGDDAWWEQVDLNKLILASNWLTEIPDDIRQLSALVVLDVHDNRIEKISDAIGDLMDLQRLNLSHNKLPTLPDVIGKLTKLQLLNVDNNQITQLCDDIGNLVNLQELNLSKNHIPELPPSINWLTKVTTLNVSQNFLTVLPIEIGSLACLKVLDASQNKLTSTPDSLEELKKLEQLYLHQNKLSSIPLLTNCAMLKEVQLGENCIAEVNADHLKTFVSVHILDLRDNKLNSLPEEIGLLQCLERLTLSNNDFSSLPYVLGTLPNLKALQLEGNPLRSIRHDIIKRGTMEIKKYLRSRMTDTELKQEAEKQTHNAPSTDTGEINTHEVHQLKTFDYSSKQVTSIPDNVWTEISSVGVTTANLNKNLLHELPPGLMVLSDTLKDLQIGFNKIEILSPDIGLYLHLVSLDLRNNCLSTLPKDMASIRNLREIIISSNRFQQLPAVLYEFPKLEILFANENKITTLDMDGLSRLKQLATLDLQNNDIANVPPELGNMSALKSLQLSGNAFRNPRPAVLAKGTTAILEYLRNKIA